MPAKFLRRLRTLHRWTGLTIGLLMVVVATSGAGLAMRSRIEPVLGADLWRSAACSAPIALDALVEQARAQARGAGALSAIRLSAAPGATMQVRFSDDRWFFVEPCSGAVLGSEDRYRGVFGTLDALHRFKYLPNSELIAGSLAGAFALVLLLGGLLLWRPSRRAAVYALTVHPRLPARAFAVSLHKSAALYAGPILLISALTGVTQAFEWPQAVLLAITGSAPSAGAGKSVPTGQLTPTTIDSFWQTAQAVVPDAQRVLMLFPKHPTDPVKFEMIAADAPHAEARSELSIDAYSGAVLQFTPYAEARLGHRVYLWLVALHTGQLGGLPGQLLLICAALSVPLLAFAGVRSYLLGRRRAHSGSV